MKRKQWISTVIPLIVAISWCGVQTGVTPEASEPSHIPIQPHNFIDYITITASQSEKAAVSVNINHPLPTTMGITLLQHHKPNAPFGRKPIEPAKQAQGTHTDRQ
jgi:hypothetical protein